ncbi:unnamed protein product [Chironomus riparius]|uniref:Uncharacterized protein n=1 Tax=Chironomus riparius TaxID=315576 RepID=A0A9N9RWE4_9DIPT|nr:unnamed protein product [Chironomus riparius]
MENSQELAGIIGDELLMIDSQATSDELMVSNSPHYMSCTEDFDIAAAAEMMHADDVRSFEEAPMEQGMVYMAECICCVDNMHQEVHDEQSVQAPFTRHVTFEMDEISATSTKESVYQLEPEDVSPVIRRSSRIESNAQKRRSSEIISATTTNIRKRRSSEMSPTNASIRKRKSTASPEISTPKIRRTSSFRRALKSPVTNTGSNQKVAKKRTSSTGRPRRQSGKFNKK